MRDSLKYAVLLELLAQLEPNFGRMLDLMVLMCSLSWQLSARRAITGSWASSLFIIQLLSDSPQDTTTEQ